MLPSIIISTEPKFNTNEIGIKIFVLCEYRTTERYVAYVDGFARNGYIVFRSDYHGHGNSEGEATGGYGFPAYTADDSVPIAASEFLNTQLLDLGWPVEMYAYDGDNHNLSVNFNTAMDRSPQFFETYVKAAGDV